MAFFVLYLVHLDSKIALNTILRSRSSGTRWPTSNRFPTMRSITAFVKLSLLTAGGCHLLRTPRLCWTLLMMIATDSLWRYSGLPFQDSCTATKFNWGFIKGQSEFFGAIVSIPQATGQPTGCGTYNQSQTCRSLASEKGSSEDGWLWCGRPFWLMYFVW